MYVSKITLEGFRNYTDATAHFDRGINVIIGDNGQGKTNLLESVFYLTSARSFKTRYDRELIGFDREIANIKADIYSQGREQKIEIVLKRGRKKNLIVNGAKVKRSADLSGKITAVLFCPEDLALVKGGPAVRRRLMDLAICQMRPKYAAFLSDFNRIYENKLRILKDFSKKPSLLDTLDEFSGAMAQRSAQLIYYRAHFVKKLSEYAAKIHGEFSQGTEKLTLEYRTVKTVRDPFGSPSEIFESLMEHQRDLRQAEIDSGQCLSGAHKDDIEIEINGKSARSFASQGQTRTAALSIKLAESEIFTEEIGEPPILLLDDVLSELDAKRQEFVLGKIRSGQVLITCCEDDRIIERGGDGGVGGGQGRSEETVGNRDGEASEAHIVSGKVLRIERGEIS